ELSGVSRRWQTYLGRIVYVGLIGAILFMTWNSMDVRNLANSSEFAHLGRRLFWYFLGIQILFVPLTALTAASDMIAKEVRAGTLGILALTPLTPWRIAFGKWKAAMTYAASLVLGGLPIIAVCVYLGGVGAWDVLWSTALTVAASSLGAALGLFYSTVFRAGYLAIIVGIVTGGAYTLLPAFLGASGSDPKGCFEALMWTHPAYAAVSAIVFMESAAREGSEYAWIGATLGSFFLSWLLLRGAAARIPRLVEAVPKASALTRTFDAMDKFYEEINPEALKDVRIFSGRGEVWERNAILWKELRTRASGKLRNATRIGLGLLLLVLLPASCAFSGRSEWQVPMLWLSGIVFLFMAMANGVSIFVKEKEARQWEILLSTPLTARQIVLAKLTAGLAALAPLAVILLVLFTLVSAVSDIGPIGWMVTVGSIGMPVLFSYVLGAAMSLRAGSMRAAFSATFGIMLGILVILPLLLAFYDTLPGVRWDGDEFPFILVTLTNPARFLEPFGRFSSYRSLDSRYPGLLPYFIAYGTIYGMAIVSLMASMILRFDRIVGRAPGRESARTPP
ncbi:MAG TPA: ABC transporter permease subunit, partial [Planctomycetota bacterium]|nr:ABC transporter permease subunit [Planctomycetota bacterium]